MNDLEMMIEALHERVECDLWIHHAALLEGGFVPPVIFENDDPVGLEEPPAGHRVIEQVVAFVGTIEVDDVIILEGLPPKGDLRKPAVCRSLATTARLLQFGEIRLLVTTVERVYGGGTRRRIREDVLQYPEQRATLIHPDLRITDAGFRL